MILEFIGNIIASVDIIGLIPSVLSTFLWISPIHQMMKAYKNNSRHNISLIFFYLSFLNCLGWTIYGLHISNMYIILPNLIGTIVVSILLISLRHLPES